MKLNWLSFLEGSEWDVTDGSVRVEFPPRKNVAWAFPLLILVFICANELWNWLNLKPFETDPLLLVWSALVLCAFAWVERHVPSLNQLIASNGRVELHDTDENVIVLAACDEIAPEIEEAELGVKTLWSVRLSGPTFELDTPYTSKRLGPHRLSQALQKTGAASDAPGDAEPPTAITCPKVRTCGAAAILIWMLGFAALQAPDGQQWWWMEPLIGSILVLPYAIHGLSSTFRVQLRVDPEGSRSARVGLFGRWRRIDDLFVGLRGPDPGFVIVPRDFVRKRQELRIALYRMLAPTFYPCGGVTGAFSFARRVRGYEGLSDEPASCPTNHAETSEVS